MTPTTQQIAEIEAALHFQTQLRAKDTGYSTIVTVEFEPLYALLADYRRLEGECERLQYEGGLDSTRRAEAAEARASSLAARLEALVEALREIRDYPRTHEEFEGWGPIKVPEDALSATSDVVNWKAEYEAACSAQIKGREAFDAFIANPPKHDYWRPGEDDCPKDIKANNGELHTLRCKRCGLDNPRSEMCRALSADAALNGGAEK